MDEQKVEASGAAVWAKFKTWLSVGDDRWYFYIAVAFVAGFLVRGCA